jgi:hypothetical protein
LTTTASFGILARRTDQIAMEIQKAVQALALGATHPALLCDLRSKPRAPAMPEKPLYGVAEDDEDRYFLLDLFRLAALVFEFGKKGGGLLTCGSQPVGALVK